MYSKNIVGLGGVRKKPTLKKGDFVSFDLYVAKHDVYGNRYHSGAVFYKPKGGTIKQLGEIKPSWGGDDMARQNAYKILEENTFKPRGKKINFKSDYRNAGIEIKEHIKEDIPIRKFNKYYS